VAKEIGYKEDLGTKAYSGILKNQKTRKEFLERENHRIRYVFTPKHCSWLYPIEYWFGKLEKQRLRHASFCSVSEIEKEIKEYIEFTNKWFAKPKNWTFMGFNNNKILYH
jgi:transposase